MPVPQRTAVNIEKKVTALIGIPAAGCTFRPSFSTTVSRSWNLAIQASSSFDLKNISKAWSPYQSFANMYKLSTHGLVSMLLQ